ncbi:DUF6545 domain-containing protein [Streptomyces sp. NBC_00299]|uniref:DUF6545 domain-containing protein n=1 Tax=Streptomyces sp. NBC_00299 TaxID=2975705 RepID=UPI002E2C34D9|nr:DUF6545 domain-containing protein [Streptomyces sp. NBC_00299]
MPGWVAGLSTASAWVSDDRTFQRRHPLWRAMTKALPAVVLEPPSRRKVARDLRFYMFYMGRQVIEIFDCEMRLRPHYSPEASRMALAIAASQKITGDKAAAAAVAAQVGAAPQAGSAGDHAPARHDTDFDDVAKGDLEREGARMPGVAGAFSESVLVSHTLTRLQLAPANA